MIPSIPRIKKRESPKITARILRSILYFENKLYFCLLINPDDDNTKKTIPNKRNTTDNFFTQYSESIILIQIMSVGIIPLTLVSIYESEYLGKEKSRIVLIGSGMGVISYFILIPLLFMIWETLGIGFAFLISSSIRALFYVMIKKFLG